MEVHRLALGNTVFEGANNAYLFDGEATVLLDTGEATDETRTALTAGIEAHGHAFADVDAVVLTHYHPDHSGLAGEIQTASGAPVYAHEADAPLIAGDVDAWDAFEATQRRLFDAWGMPEPAQSELVAYLDAAEEVGIYGDPVDVTTIEDGTRLDIGELTLETHHTPGHAAGLCCFVDTDRPEELYTGDALLPEYTPNVGGADVRLEGALAAYVETLEWLIDADFERAWPGHREPIDDPTARARYILDHHEERTYRVASALERLGPADAWTVSDALFGALENIHILHGPGEAHAHLEHLREQGAVAREEPADEPWAYELTPGGRDRLETLEGGRWPLGESV